MRDNRVVSPFALEKHSHRTTSLEPVHIAWLYGFLGRAHQAGAESNSAMSVEADPGLLCQAACTALAHSQHLQAVIRPLLPRTTWEAAVEVARHGGHTLPTETHQAAILWLDIARFSELFTSRPLDQVLTDLNAYLDALTEVVYRHGGDVNKYLGDGFLAVFGAADAAVRAGCALQSAADDFNVRQRSQERGPFHTRIGIDTGQVAVVSLGSRDRQDRTVIGAPVILAERLQEQAPAGRVWLSQATFERLGDRSGCHVVGLVKVKGQAAPVLVYETRRWL